MLVIDQKIKTFTDKEKEAFFKKFKLKPNTTYEFRRPQSEIFKQEVVISDNDARPINVQRASASKRVPFRYLMESEEVIWCTNFTPASPFEKPNYGRKPEQLKFRNIIPIKVNTFDFLWFLMNHPDRKDSPLNIAHKNGSFGFYLFEPEKEAALRNQMRMSLSSALSKIEDLKKDNEKMLMTARGFQIQDAHLLDPEVLYDRLSALAESNPASFLGRFSTAEFVTSSLVYEAEEKRIIINDRGSHSWYMLFNGKELGDKIYTYLPTEKPYEALINYLRNTNNDWLDGISKVLKGKVAQTPEVEATT